MNKATTQMELLDLKTLEETPGNPQRMTHFQFEGLVNSIKEKGWLLDNAVVWHRPDGVYQIISGHHRVKAAIAAGIERAEIKVIKGITDEQARKLVLEANQRKGVFDKRKFNQFIDGIVSDFKLDLDDVLKEIGAGYSDWKDKNETEAPDLVKTDIEAGDLFEIGDHRLYCGDAFSVDDYNLLTDGTEADLNFSDPPYQIECSGSGIIRKVHVLKRIEDRGLDNFKPSADLLKCKTNIFCHSKMQIGEYFEIARQAGLSYDLCIYRKINSIPNYKGHLMSDLEYIAIIGSLAPVPGYPRDMYSKLFVGKKDSDNLVGYSKPIELCEKFIMLYSSNSVLDLFGGSGSTMVACQNLKRSCFTMEINPVFCQVIINRMKFLFPDIKVKRNGESYG